MFLIFLGAFLFIQISCGKDDVTDFFCSIVGNWHLYAQELYYQGLSVPFNKAKSTLSSCQQRSNNVTFFEDGTGNVIAWIDSLGTCRLQASYTVGYTYNTSSKVLSTKIGAKTEVVTLKMLSASEMVSEETVSDFPIEGYPFSGKITHYTKRKK